VPPHDGLGPYDGNGVYDRPTQPIEPYEDQPVDDAEPLPGWPLPAQDHQLMAEDKKPLLRAAPAT
jgi:hypothetical protein